MFVIHSHATAVLVSTRAHSLRVSTGTCAVERDLQEWVASAITNNV